MLVGRNHEIEALDGILEAAASGRGALRLLAGEPGIGKTRLADEMVLRATAKGFLASWGRAWETEGAPVYWPWIEVLSPLVEGKEDVPERVRMLLGSSAAATLGEGTRADPARDRFELFECVSSFMRSCARKTPLLLVFDDLHMADAPTLELLSFVARGMRTARIFALGTYRDAESRLPRVADLLARISREGEVVALRPLAEPEVAEILARETGRSDPVLSTAIHALTEGNPLFLREAIHAVTQSKSGVSLDALRDVAALGGVLALVRSRLLGADPRIAPVLEVAAALGRESELSLLVLASGVQVSEVRAAIADAVARGLLVRRGDDRFAFSHVLVREAIYRELSDERRREVHRAIALALEKRDTEVLSATLAHHALAALPSGEPVDAVRKSCRAAAYARSHLAYEEALALLERALATCEQYRIDDHERAEVSLALGWAATEAGKLERGRDAFREAAKIARRLADPMLLARAALGQGGEYVLAEIRPELVDGLREALALLEGVPGDEVRRLRARVLARLAAALTPSATPAEPLALAREALLMTENESDVRTRIDVDVGVGAALTDFAPPGERIVVNDRLLRHAQRVADRVLELRALTRLSCEYLERGDVARSDASIAARARLAESIGHPRYRWQTPLLRSMQAMPRGRFDDCEEHIREARRIAAETPDPNAERCIEFHRFSMLLVAGRLEDLRAQEAAAQRTLLSLVGNTDLHVWLTAIGGARVGDRTRAAEALRVAGPRDGARMERITLLEAAVLCEMREIAGPLYAAFDVLEDANACWGPFAFACSPPIARTLAMASFFAGETEGAIRHCERALELAQRTEAAGHLAWVHLAWGEGTGSSEHLGRAGELAEELVMPEITARVEKARGLRRSESPRATTSSPPSQRPGPVAFSLRKEADRAEWVLAYAGRTFRLKDVRGLSMLARLVESPDREIHAIDLAADRDDGGGVIDLGDSGEVLDLRARDAYKRRIAELREELAEAETLADRGRAMRLRAELEALTDQIAAAVGMGGRERRAGSAAERARVTVQRRIREAIKKIAEHDAELGRHLDWTVRTGTFCAYEPSGRKSAR